MDLYLAFDLVNYGNTGTPERRHSITLCETPSLNQLSSASLSPPTSLPQSRNTTAPSSPAHQDFPSTSQTQRDFLSSVSSGSSPNSHRGVFMSFVLMDNVAVLFDFDLCLFSFFPIYVLCCCCFFFFFFYYMVLVFE